MFDAEFDELNELELYELYDRVSILLNELEAGCSFERDAEIHDELNSLYEKIDLIK